MTTIEEAEAYLGRYVESFEEYVVALRTVTRQHGFKGVPKPDWSNLKARLDAMAEAWEFIERGQPNGVWATLHCNPW